MSRAGGRCQKHLQCPALEVCDTQSGQCASAKCERDRDCVDIAERNKGAGQVWCHPQGFCSGRHIKKTRGKIRIDDKKKSTFQHSDANLNFI